MNILEKFFSINKYTEHSNLCNKVKISLLGIKLTFTIQKKKNKIKSCVAVIDCGGIGDYMMCRPYFKYLKQSPKFKGAYFIYLCKDAYKEMTKIYDKDIFNEVIPYDKNYKKIKKELNKKYEIDTLINIYGLSKGNGFRGWKKRYNLIKNLNIKNKIADVTIDNKEDLKNKNLKIYNTLILTEPNVFDLERRRQFFSKLTGVSIPQINKKIVPFFDFQKDYICISPYTNTRKRDYDNKKWIEILNYLIENTGKDIQIVLLGGKNDRIEIDLIFKNLKSNNKCINLSGLIDASLLPSILKNAKCLISMETGTVHIAESVNCPTLCISCGAYYGKMLPYKNPNIHYVFPDKFEELLLKNNPNMLKDFYQANWTFSAKDILSEKVINYINKYLPISPKG